MYQFAVLLRAVACFLITNSHMEQVYPHKALANGGLLGDVLFFALSGFLLYSVQQAPFFKWYYKRLRRVYLSTWVAVLLFLCHGIYGNVSLKRLFQLFIWPTQYHFVSSILVLYIVFYFFVRFVNLGKLKNRRILLAGVCLTVVFLAVFYTLFDYSHYHIDSVYSPMIWPLYLSAMMIGMFFRVNLEQFISRVTIWSWLGIFLSGAAYTATKLGFSRGALPESIQWANQVTLLLTLFFVFWSFTGLESLIMRIPSSVFAPFRFVSERAFEIYLVQIPLIPIFNTGKNTFPKNLFIVLGVIFLSACIVHALVDILLQAQSWLAVKKEEKV